MIIKYNVGSKPHEAEFKTESKFVEWITNNYKYKIFEISGAAEKGITLKNIDLSNVAFASEVNKYDEETNEFFQAIHCFMNSKTKENKEHLIEEFWDTVQAEIGLLDKLGITAQEIMKEYPKHLEKIKNRPRVKGD